MVFLEPLPGNPLCFPLPASIFTEIPCLWAPASNRIRTSFRFPRWAAVSKGVSHSGSCSAVSSIFSGGNPWNPTKKSLLNLLNLLYHDFNRFLTFSILNPREKSQTSTEYRPRWVNVIASSAQCGVSGMRDALQSSFKANYYWRRLKKMCYIQKITKYKNMSLCFLD